MGRTRRKPETDATAEADAGEGMETYEQILARTAEALDQTRDVLVSASEALLIRGAFRAWCDAAPIGVSVTFSDEAVRSAPDKRVQALMNLADAVERTVETLRKESAAS